MLKAVVTGAYSTGKTTLVDALHRRLRDKGVNCVVLPDVARESPISLNESQTDNGSLWLMTSQISREIAASQGSADIVLCDRGVPDILAHHEEVLERGDSRGVQLMRPFLEYWMSSYDIILFSRIDGSLPIARDGVRVSSPAYRSKLDIFSQKVLRDLPAVQTLPNDGEERLRYALDAILVRLILRE